MSFLDFEKLSVIKPKSFVFSDLVKAFDSAIVSATKNVSSCAVLFSGGVDSSLIAKSVSDRVKDCTLFSVGLKNSYDLLQAKKAAKLLNLNLKSFEIPFSSLFELKLQVSKIINSNDFLQLSIAVPEFFALKKIKESNFSTVFSGQGSDELFLGYAVFFELLKEKGIGAVRVEQKNLFDVFEQRNVLRESFLADYFSLDVRMPFLDELFASVALSIPVEQNLQDSLRKNVFRNLALEKGVPREIALMPKKAIQYGSGISKELRKLV